MTEAKKDSHTYDDLDDLFGKWDETEFKENNSKIAAEHRTDPELWSPKFIPIDTP